MIKELVVMFELGFWLFLFINFDVSSFVFLLFLGLGFIFFVNCIRFVFFGDIFCDEFGCVGGVDGSFGVGGLGVIVILVDIFGVVF